MATVTAHPRLALAQGALGPVGLWVLTAVSLVSVMATLLAALVLTPPEAVEGNVFRIFYVHVPLAWLCYLAFFVVFAASILFLWRRDPVWDRVARVAVEIGLLYTTLVLIVGSIWGRPVWGVWWTWDPRLTSTLVMWFVYLAYLLLRSYTSESGQSARYAAVLGIVGFVNVPIVQFSVDWWRSLHPQATVLEAGHLAPSMLITMLLGLGAFTVFGVLIFALRFQLETLRDDVHAIQRQLEEAEG